MTSKRFRGSIIITDPCYIDPNRTMWDDKEVDLNTGKGIEQFGFNHYMWDSTGGGDWSIEMLIDGKNSHGIAADSGLVGVFYLNDVTKFEPNLDIDFLSRSGLATVVYDFDGRITFEEGDPWTIITGSGSHDIRMADEEEEDEKEA